MNNIMIDIEALDIKPTAAIISIAAAFFEPLTGEVGSTLYLPVDVIDAQCQGGTIGAGTIKWWMKQNQAARDEITSNAGLPLSTALYRLNDFCDSCDDLDNLKLWARGADYDFPIIYQSMRLIGIRPLWSFRNVRDVRTVAEVALALHGHASRRTVFDQSHHAMNDVINQIAKLSDDMKIIAASRVREGDL
ncbi:3'-5' exoribonuclease [Salmonella enterica subsp. enterica]|nr:3'-5' exoribonuclease [Salmonella enterica subsp. enterica serovar Wangata]ECK7389130.1 3'-5' exoribonuclease [Salmonella enterica subsp. enterica serovar Meleagridis]EDS7057552.1 3'-5' exoribonuclease [Salmonella enterica subsp. enterica]EDT2941140.1 3'-5' exoribonuclease [Salmonella enterica subsp. enterica]